MGQSPGEMSGVVGMLIGGERGEGRRAPSRKKESKQLRGNSLCKALPKDVGDTTRQNNKGGKTLWVHLPEKRALETRKKIGKYRFENQKRQTIPVKYPGAPIICEKKIEKF